MKSNTPAKTEYTFLKVPASAWDLLSETLGMDAESGSFETSLREDISAALDQVELFQPSAVLPSVLDDVLKFLDSLPATSLQSQNENRQAMRRIINVERLRTSARKNKIHVCALTSEGPAVIHTGNEDEAETFLGSYDPPVIRPTFIVEVDPSQEIQIREVEL